MPEVHLGCSGWSYSEWVPVFYPSAEEPKLRYYAGVFDTAEIDSTFYALPQKGVPYGWVRATPDEFRFAAKLPQTITHEQRVAVEAGVETELQRFLTLMRPVQDAGKLGPLLIQLPPSFRRDEASLERFLDLLPAGYEWACEFRHRSWWREETWRLLRKYGVANVIVDEPLLPPERIVTAEFAFIRWHGHGRSPWYNYRYSVEELQPWVPKVEAVAREVRRVYGYFNNHFHGYAVANCLQMLELLRLLRPTQRPVLQRALAQLERAPTPSVLAYDPRVAPLDDLLQLFLDQHRLDRAREIPDTDVTELQTPTNQVRARIREYQVLVDRDAREIVHDCSDWAKRAPAQQFCKHLGKVFLNLPVPEAEGILRAIASDKEAWLFRVAASAAHPA